MSTPLTIRAYDAWLIRSKQFWRSMLTYAVLGPLLFLAAMGGGLGHVISGNPPPSLGGVRYLDFVAPGMLAAAAMQNAVGEATWPVLDSVKWNRGYFAMLATPLRVRDVYFGHLLLMVTRVTVGAIAFVAAALLLGARMELTGLFVIPAATLTGLAFAAPIAAWAVTRETDGSLAVLHRNVVMPLFMFSGTFFPLANLPDWLERIVWLTPLWHGVDLCRNLALGPVDAGRTAVHVGYLVALAVVGMVLGPREYAKALES